MTHFSFSQVESPCAQSLLNAREEFQHGHFFLVKGLLEKCLRNGFSREQRIEANYILTRTYLYLDKPDSAEYHFLELLKDDPEYRVDEVNDPVDIVYLADKFTTTPIISMNARIGTNYNLVNSLKDYRVSANLNDPENYSGSVGYQVSIGTEIHFSDHLSLMVAPTAMSRRWKYSSLRFYSLDNQTADFLNMTENVFTLNVPFVLKYMVDRFPFRPYFYMGYSQNLMFYAIQNFEGADVNGDINIPFSGSDPNLRNRRISSGNIVLGAGSQYKVGRNYIQAEIQYNLPLQLMNNPSNRILETDGKYKEESNWNFAYVDDDFKVSTISLNIGITKPLYKPRRKDKFTLRTFFDEVSQRFFSKNEEY